MTRPKNPTYTSNKLLLFDFRNFHALRKGYVFLLFLHVSKSKYFFSNLNYNCSNILDMRNLQEQVKKAFCYKKLF